MSVLPKWEEFMAPVMRALLNGEVKTSRELREAAADELAVTPEGRAEAVPSGELRLSNRSNWAMSFLSRAGAIERIARGNYSITDVGRSLLSANPTGITERVIKELIESKKGRSKDDVIEPETITEETVLDPVEQVAEGIARVHATISSQLIQRLHGHEPEFFEQAVLDVLMAMGFGGSDGRATRTQLSGDGGIDGIIDQDALGLSRVYVQAKRWDPASSIGRPDIQAFVGALAGHQANQGVYITTGRYSSGALQYARNLPTRVVLIDGNKLASLMIRYKVGVQVESIHELIKIDEDFFE